jgi:hypothetical protein
MAAVRTRKTFGTMEGTMAALSWKAAMGSRTATTSQTHSIALRRFAAIGGWAQAVTTAVFAMSEATGGFAVEVIGVMLREGLGGMARV